MIPRDKKLLVLGSNIGSVEIVQYAKSKGVHTIVADYLPPEKSPAKKVADEHVLISTADIDSLSDLIINKGVNSVFAGISEFNLLRAQELCEKHNLPFYCSSQQWETIENKASFRKLCLKCGVPAPITYYSGPACSTNTNDVNFPCVVKPVDASSSQGVSICKNTEQLSIAIDKAKDSSSTGNIIIEDFCEGDEFTAHYVIENGVGKLVCVDNRYPIELHKGATTIPIARIYPCSFLNEYIDQVNDSLLEVCKSIGCEQAVLFIQGIYDVKSNKFAIFEGGLRCAGEAAYRIIDNIFKYNFLFHLVDYAISDLTKKSTINDISPDLMGKKAAIFSFATSGGVLHKIDGLDLIKKRVPSVIYTECRYPIGSVIPKGDTLRQIVLRFTLVSKDKRQLKNDIRTINKLLRISDTDGRNICVHFDHESIIL